MFGIEALKNLSSADQPKLAQGIPGRWKQVKSDVPTAMNRVEATDCAGLRIGRANSVSVPNFPSYPRSLSAKVPCSYLGCRTECGKNLCNRACFLVSHGSGSRCRIASETGFRRGARYNPSAQPRTPRRSGGVRERSGPLSLATTPSGTCFTLSAVRRKFADNGIQVSVGASQERLKH